MEEDPASLHSYNQWDEDNVDLSSQTVPDLLHLLPDRDDQLDHHLYQQAVIIHALLRKELHSVTQRSSGTGSKSQELVSTILNPSDELSTVSRAYSSVSFTSADNSYASTTTSLLSHPISQDPGDNIQGSMNTFSSSSVDDNLSSDFRNILSNEKFHVYTIFCIILFLIFLFFITLFVIIFRCKSSFQKRPREPNLQLHSYLKASISHEDSYSICVNIPTKDPALSPAVPMAPYSPLSTFSTFHPPGQGSTSPEGRSSGEQEGEGVENAQKVEETDDKDDNVASREDKECLYAKINCLAKTQRRGQGGRAGATPGSDSRPECLL